MSGAGKHKLDAMGLSDDVSNAPTVSLRGGMQGPACGVDASDCLTRPLLLAPQEMTEDTGPTQQGSGTSSKRKIRRWTEAEHDSLVQLVAKLGEDACWATIAEHIPGRTGKQCRERWVNHIGCAGWRALCGARALRSCCCQMAAACSHDLCAACVQPMSMREL
jgi:hypothetical protein